MEEVTIINQEAMKDKAIVRFLNSMPWAIVDENLDVIIQVVSNHIDGKNVTLASDRATVVGVASAPEVAIVPITGTIAKRFYGLDAISGNRTTKDIQTDIQNALDNPKIRGIVLSIDSPGGTVDGTKELADFVYNNRGKKPIIAYADGMMASAAYWIGAAADKIVAFDTAKVGSIGVLMRHIDYSKQHDKLGIKVTHLFSGEYKALGNSAEPLSKVSREYIQEHLDYMYSIFVDSVAKYRGMDVKDILNAAGGKVYIGKQSLEVGLVDIIGNLQAAIELAQGGEMDKKDLKATLQEVPVDEAIAALIEQHGEEAISAAMKPAEPQAPELAPEVQTMLDQMQSKLDEVTTKLGEANTTIAKMNEDATAKAARNAAVEVIVAVGIEASDELVEAVLGMSDSHRETILSTIGGFKKRADDLAESLLKETDGAVTGGDEGADDVQTLDQALAYIQKRDGIEDVDAALAKARVEFPNLYKA